MKKIISHMIKYFDIKENLKTQLKSWMSQQGDLGVETEMKAVTRQRKENI